MVRKSRFLMAALMFVSMASACSSTGGGSDGAARAKNSPGDSKINTEPVELLFFGQRGKSAEQFDLEVGQHVKKKFPNVTLKYVEPTEADTLNKMVAAGMVPDLGYNAITSLRPMEVDVPVDLLPFMKKYNYNLSDLIDSQVQLSMLTSGFGTPNGKMYYLPYENASVAAVYNKNVFDRFGVPYPKDGLTWEDVMDYARKLTRAENDIVYQGAHIDYPEQMFTTRGLDYIDAKTNKSLFTSDGWIKLAEFYRQFYSIPNMPLVDTWMNGFLKNQNIALIPTFISPNLMDQLVQAEKSGLSYDLISYPVWKDSPGVIPGAGGIGFFVSKHSKHQDWAFQVIASFVYDVEIAKERAKLGVMSILKNPEITKVYGINSPIKDKNVKAITYYPNAKKVTVPVYKYNGASLDIWKKEVVPQLVSGTKDIVTLMREAQEKSDKNIAQQIADEKK